MHELASRSFLSFSIQKRKSRIGGPKRPPILHPPDKFFYKEEAPSHQQLGNHQS